MGEMENDHPCIKRALRGMSSEQAVHELGDYLEVCDFICERKVGAVACSFFTRFDNPQNSFDDNILIDTSMVGIDCQIDTAKKAAHRHYANGGAVDLTEYDRQPIALPGSMPGVVAIGQGAVFSELADNAFEQSNWSDSALGSF